MYPFFFLFVLTKLCSTESVFFPSNPTQGKLDVQISKIIWSHNGWDATKQKITASIVEGIMLKKNIIRVEWQWQWFPPSVCGWGPSVWSLHVLPVPAFSPGTLASSHSPKTCRFIGNSKLPVGVSLSVSSLSVSIRQPCDWLPTCPGWILPITQCQLGSAPAPHNPLRISSIDNFTWLLWWRGTEPEGKAFNVPIDLCSSPHLWSWVLGSDRKNEIMLWLYKRRRWVSSEGWLSGLRNRVRSSDIRRELGEESLLFGIERSHLRWFRHLIRMPPGHLPLEVFWARPTVGRPRSRPRTCWWDYISPKRGWKIVPPCCHDG